MLDLTKNLNPNVKYIFQTSHYGKTNPMTVKQFLKCSQANEELIAIDSGIPCESEKIWSKYDGWYANAFAKMVGEMVSFVDKSQDVNPDFIDCAIEDGLSVFGAAESWFDGTEIVVGITHHLAGSSGLIDIDIQGISSVRRVVLSMGIKKGDMFNIYYGESSKGGGTWDTDLKRTLDDYFNRKAA